MSDASPTQKQLPFKRTAPRKKTTEDNNATTNKKPNDDDGFFNRPASSFMEVYEQRQRALDEERKRSVSVAAEDMQGSNPKRPKISLDLSLSSDEESGSKRPWSPESRSRSRKMSSMPRSPDASTKRNDASLESDSDDIIMDVKGKGKEVIRYSKGRMTKSITPSKFKPYIDLNDDEDGDFRTPSKRLRLTPSASGSSGKKTKIYGQPVEILSDDDDGTGDDDAGAFDKKKRVAKKELRVNDDEAVSDAEPPAAEPQDEFAEYILKARERLDQANKAKEAKTATSGGSSFAGATSTTATDTGYDDPSDKDATIVILMASQMEGTKPVKVRRKMMQDMRLPLQTWIYKQREQNFQIPDDVTESLILTWRDNEIYPTTTAAGLGVEIDALGHIHVPSLGSGPAALPAIGEEGFIRGGIQLEVWTREEYAVHQAEKERERQRSLGLLDDDDDDTYGGGATSATNRLAGLSASTSAAVAAAGGQAGHTTETSKTFRLMLKPKELEPLKLMGHADTPVAKLIDAFRSNRGILPELDVTLQFDGEKLEESTLLADLDLESDLPPDEWTCLDVHIK